VDCTNPCVASLIFLGLDHVIGPSGTCKGSLRLGPPWFPSKWIKIGSPSFKPTFDENQQAQLKDPLHVLVGPITRARSKKIKEALNGLIQDIWADSTTGHSKLGPKEDEGVINLIQATDGADHA
jgi:hypothetical protein